MSTCLTFVIPHAGPKEPLLVTINSLLTLYPRCLFEIIIISNSASNLSFLTTNPDLAGLNLSVFQEEFPPSIYNAMNLGARLSQSSFVHFLNCGDVVHSSFYLVFKILSECLDPFTIHAFPTFQHHLNPSFCRFFYPPNSRLCCLITNCWAHSSLIYPSILFQQINYDIEYKCAADYLLTMTSLFSLPYKYNPHLSIPYILSMAPPGFSAHNAIICSKELSQVRRKFILKNFYLMPLALCSYLYFKLSAFLHQVHPSHQS